jgi:hypothetical protein
MPNLPPASLVLDALQNVALPAFAAAGVLAALVALVAGPRGATIAAALGVAAGLAAANHFRNIVPWVPDDGAHRWHYVLWVTAAALLVEAVTWMPRVPRDLAWILWAGVAAAAAAMTLPAPIRDAHWWALPAFVWLNLALWGGLGHLSRRDPGGGPAVGLALAFLGVAAVAAHAASLSMIDLATAAAFALLGVALAAWWRKVDVAGAVPAAAILLPAILLTTYQGERAVLAILMEGDPEGAAPPFVPWDAYALLAVSPLAMALTLLPPLNRLQGRWLRVVQIGLAAVPVVVAVVRTMRAVEIDFDSLA